jgi:hypothetical protein
MTKLHTTDLSKYYDSLEDAKEDYAVVKCTSLLGFYKLKSKPDKETLTKVKEYSKELQSKWDSSQLSEGGAISIAKKQLGVSQEKLDDICKDNLEPICYLPYLYYSPVELRYYLKVFPNYSVEDFFFFKPLLDFGQNELIKILRERILEGFGVWLLFNKQQIKEVGDMLVRVWNANRSDKGKLQYHDFLRLAELMLKQQDYVENMKNATGYKTVCNQFSVQVQEFWKTAKSNTK